MILYSFIFLWVLLYTVFTWLAFDTKSTKVYLAGCIISFLYFLSASEGIIFAFHRKVPLIGFLVNPFPGNYKLFSLNFHYHWSYFLTALLSYIVVFFILKKTALKNKILRSIRS
jgi:hypothetical protein